MYLYMCDYDCICICVITLVEHVTVSYERRSPVCNLKLVITLVELVIFVVNVSITDLFSLLFFEVLLVFFVCSYLNMVIYSLKLKSEENDAVKRVPLE